MLYWLGIWFSSFWGPFRLLSSHLVLIALGTLLGGLVVWRGLPRFWHRLPQDRGKVIAADGGVKSKGKPTGAGLLFSLLLLPVLVLAVPPDPWLAGVVVCLYLGMLIGYLDDHSAVAWGEWRKGITDLGVAVVAAVLLCHASPAALWVPFIKHTVVLSPWLYVPITTTLLWFTMNATNCSDGVDGLAGTLTLISLFSLAGLLYGVVGYRPIAEYLLIPHNADGAKWAIVVATVAGGLAGYLWHNAEPSRVLMGDAGSRLLGLLVGVAVMQVGNPFLIFVVSPVVLVNGGTGLFKLLLLRAFKKLGFDTTPTSRLSATEAAGQHVLVRALHSVRFPLHDHCRRNLGWSNAQVLMRFSLIQAFLTPVLFVILMKVR